MYCDCKKKEISYVDLERHAHSQNLSDFSLEIKQSIEVGISTVSSRHLENLNL